MTFPDARAGSLPPDLSAFLTQLSVTLHKYRAYPAGHPMRSDARDAILSQLAYALDARPALRIAVARRHLLVDDVASDPAQPVLGELAERLHRRQIGALVLKRGVSAADLEATLERLNADPRRLDPETVTQAEQIGDCVELIPLSYAHLMMGGDQGAPSTESTDELWAELARLTAAPASAIGGGGARAMAAALLASKGDRSSRTAVVKTLERFGRASVRETGARGIAARRALREMLDGIPREELVSLLNLDLARPGAIGQLIEAAEWLPLSALTDLVESAASASGQTVSHFLLRLLRKLGNRSEAIPESDAEVDHGTRESIQSLLQGWNLADPNPDVHTRLLEELSRRDQGSALPAGAALTEPERIVRMGLEVGVAGPLILEAVDCMLESGQLGLLLGLVETPETNPAAGEIWTHLLEPACLRRLLLEEPVDHGACAKILTRVGLDSAEGLLDSLTISESQDTRRLILHRLSELGPGVGPLLVARLDAAPWYLRRNLLGLLADLPSLPEGFTARRYAEEAEPLLRLEALRLMLRSEADREDALHRALGDPDDRVVRLGFEAGAGQGVSRALLPRLMKLLNDGTRSPELRARGIALLVQFVSPTVRQWLIERILVRRGFFRRTRLAPKSADLLAGVGVLVRVFPGHPQTLVVQRLATQSGDPDIIDAAGGPVA
jgi:hypothetical protein